MIMRRTEKGDEEKGKSKQFEVRHRHPEHYYELRDVQRCILEWRAYDPRRMLKEDPREEYFMQRLRSLELRTAASMQEEKKKDAEVTKKSNHVERKLAKRQNTRTLAKELESQFNTGRIYAKITSRPGQSGRCDGYILEGAELKFYLNKMSKKK